MQNEAERVRDLLATILRQWYGDEKKDTFIFLDGLSYHQHAAQSILRELAIQAAPKHAELPEGKVR